MKFNGPVRYAVWADDNKSGTRQSVGIGNGNQRAMRLVTTGIHNVKNGTMRFDAIRNLIDRDTFIVIRAMGKGASGQWMGIWKDFECLFIKNV